TAGGSARLGYAASPVRRSCVEHGGDFAIAHGLIRETEGAVLAYFSGSTKKSAEGSSGESTADADPLDTQFRKLREAQLNPLQAHDYVHGAVHGTDHRGDILLALETRRIQNVGPCILIRLKPFDGVLEVWAAHQVVLRPRRQQEGKGQ